MIQNKQSSVKIYFFLLSFFLIGNAFSQQGTWAKDSLSFYEKIFWNQVGIKDTAAAIKTINYIQEKGAEDLDAKIFDFFSATMAREKEIVISNVLGELLSAQGTLEFFRGDIMASKAAFKKAKLIYSKAKLLNQVAGMAMNIGVMHEKGGYYDSAILNYQEALPIFELQKDISSLASVNENIALAYLNQSQYPKALTHISKSDSLLSTYLDSINNRWIGFYFNKYLILKELNRQDEGFEVLLKALRIAEHNKNQSAIAKVHYKLSDVFDYKGDSQKQYSSLLKAKSYFKNTQNLLDIANVNSSLLNYHFSSGDLDSASLYAQKCLEFFEPYGFQEETGITYGMLGNVAFKKNNYTDAVIYFEKALARFADQKSQNYAGYLFNIGYAYTKTGDYKSALDYLEKSLAIRKELKGYSDLQESYQGLAETYQKKGDYKNAYDYLSLYQVYKDSAFNETKNKQLTELETQYETEKKDKAIADLEQEKELQNLRADKQQAQIYLSIGGLVILLGVAGLFFRQATLRKKYNMELEFKNGEIAKQNAERELLLKEIHHRVKNNLQIISSLLSMQTRGLKDDKMKDAMKESQSRVKTMALIHEKLYQYENLSKINMQEYIQQLSEFLTQTYRSDKDIKITINAADINLDMDTAIPLGLITNELLSNSLKYAFEDSESGEIIISFSQLESGAYKLLITDTGKGLDENLDIDAAKSLGLKLVRTLTRQINGQLRIVHHPGATFEIDFSEQKLAA
ncbi:MAG: hypothetical protein C0433_00245 [Cyclobacterium sp.]|nr:hypothetical protein [Cyclobacterium sp.]